MLGEMDEAGKFVVIGVTYIDSQVYKIGKDYSI
jgi:hypothetical protein